MTCGWASYQQPNYQFSSTENGLKVYTPGQLVFVYDMIVLKNTYSGLVISTPETLDAN